MKVLLINPPRSPYNALLEHASADSLKYIHKKLIGPPLGLLTIAKALEDMCDTELLDLKAIYDMMELKGTTDIPSYTKLVEEKINSFCPDIVGVTFIASEFNDGMEILKTVKTLKPDTLTIAGGLHTTLCVTQFFHKAVDIVCYGESTKKIRSIAKAFLGDKKYEKILGLYVKSKNGDFVHTGKSEKVDTAREDYLVPKRELVKPWLSTYVVGKAPGPSTYMFTSLGCLNRCTFCSIWPQYNGCFRQRAVESIVEELKQIPEYPVVRFADADTLTDPNFLETLFKRIEQEKIQKAYIMDMRVDAAVKYPKLIEQLAEGGLKVVISGFESFRDEELKTYNKSSDAALIAKAVEVFKQNNIMIRGNYVIPPSYKQKDFEALKKYASQNAVAYAGYTVLTPMPGTLLYNEMKNEIVDHNLSKYNFFNCVTKTALPLETFYKNTANLWSVREGEDVI